MKQSSVALIAPVLLALGAFAAGHGWEMFQRAELEVRGTVIASNTVCQQPKNNRCVSTYAIKSNGVPLQYVAGPTSHDLHDLPLGAEILKEKWRLEYRVNGIRLKIFQQQAVS